MDNTLKIATHNSATGEAGRGFLSWLVTPFAKCQSKTIKEQYDAGCRMFDLRFIEEDDEFYCAHGLWTSNRTLKDILQEIEDLGDTCYVSLTYEGKHPDYAYLKTRYAVIKSCYPYIVFQYLAVKYGKDATSTKVKYDILEHTNAVGGVQGFLPLDGRSWHTYLPIPWLWKKIYHNRPTFDDKVFTYVDFL